MSVDAVTRMATRIDPVLQIREDATLIRDAEHDDMFCVIYRPVSEARGGIVICSALLAEHLKTYRTEVLAARAFAARGFAVARFHYRGTGHSGGVTETATVSTMLHDVAEASEYLSKLADVPLLAFCGVRWGALIGGLAAHSVPGAPLVLWEPVVDGTRYFRDIFRARQMSALTRGEQITTAPHVLEELRTIGFVDVMGYPVHSDLYEGAAGRSLMEVAAGDPRPVLLAQVSRHKELKPEFASLMTAFAAGGSNVETIVLEAEEAWSFVGRPVEANDAMIDGTLPWLTRVFPKERVR